MSEEPIPIQPSVDVVAVSHFSPKSLTTFTSDRRIPSAIPPNTQRAWIKALCVRAHHYAKKNNIP